MTRRVLSLLVSICCSMAAYASPYDPIIDRAARDHGIDRFVLRAIATQESNKKPWTFNVDGEGFHFASKDKAVNALRALTKAPWLVKIMPPEGGKSIRRFFPSQASAVSFLNAYQRGRGINGQSLLVVRSDDGKKVSRGEARIRRVWLINTDIGIAQINYRYHGQSKATVQRWFDPAFNLDYAARHLADMKSKYAVSDFAAAGYYHSKTPSVRQEYLKRFTPIYEKERKAGNGPTLASN